MNTIPSTFNSHHIKRTVLGGKILDLNATMDVSVILLNESGTQFHIPLIENLLTCGFKRIVSIEPNNQNFNIENVVKKYPTVKFLIPIEQSTTGELINTGMREVDSKYVLVLRDSIYIPSGFLMKNMADNLMKEDIFCLVPRLVTREKESIPMRIIPKAQKGHFIMEAVSSVSDMVPSVYPFDFVGLYNREKFIHLGGFDYTIDSPYWQLADLSLRAWLWGEEIKITTRLYLSYKEEQPIPDITANLSSLRFYLKNMVPKFKNGKAYISKIAFFSFLRKSSCGFFETLRQFKDARSWVSDNKYRFTQDLQDLIENWKL